MINDLSRLSSMFEGVKWNEMIDETISDHRETR